ncbi:MAG TPA: HDIG domain-containing protein [Candidatus Elarobacter sp.]|nr:HDIG domain-containing protein [Candidatus Elarobacter sp.]
MNLWRRLEARGSGEDVDPPDRGKPSHGHLARPPFVPRIDVALQVAALVARVVLDPRVAFAAAILIAIFVPRRVGELLTAAFVALGSLLVYRAPHWRRIPDHLRWLAWADLGNPLLRRLSLEAPGTYAHTIAMANLTEAACNAIGADGLLGRVGSYYHDIGKLRKPQHFVENQPRGRNPHDKLKPATSASIIRNHVREGVELARDAGVPAPIRAFITEHHGTLPISYFLAKARERDDTVNVAEYAYGGPRPQSAETAVCMLADGVEASVRSLPDPTPTAIRETVEALIARRMEEGQLADAPITLRQLSIVRDQFVRILTGMYHGRVEYPTATGRTLEITPSSRASA